MSISNIQETLLMYTKQKSAINLQLSDVMMDMVSATRKNAELQLEYSEKLQDAYFDEQWGGDSPEYQMILEEYENDHMYDLAILDSWESELELKKNNLETRLNEITTYENNWQKMLQNNIKNDFSYGGSNK